MSEPAALVQRPGDRCNNYDGREEEFYADLLPHLAKARLLPEQLSLRRHGDDFQ